MSKRKPNKGGRPRRSPYVRLQLILGKELAEYLELAWRTHRIRDGSLASGRSAFIADLIARHQAKSKGRQ